MADPLDTSRRPSEVPGRYCNSVFVGASKWDFNLDFYQVVPPEIATGQEQVDIRQAGVLLDRIIMSPPHAKAFLAVLEENAKGYEEQYGEIADLRGQQ